MLFIFRIFLVVLVVDTMTRNTSVVGSLNLTIVGIR
jgi:hypothetical protein